jgi:hypothetical protein
MLRIFMHSTQALINIVIRDDITKHHPPKMVGGVGFEIGSHGLILPKYKSS